MNEEMKRELDKIIDDILQVKGWAGDDRQPTTVAIIESKNAQNEKKQ